MNLIKMNNQIYTTENLLPKAIEAIEKNRLIFVSDVIAYLPCHKETFHIYFPAGSDQHKTIVELLEKNRVELKVSMRSKWYKSNAPALQLALMKLLSTDEELKKLSMQYLESDNKTEQTINIINLGDGIKPTDADEIN